MIVPAMNEWEVYKEFIEDAPSVIRAVSAKVRLKRMIMMRTHTYKWVETLHIKSRRNNHWSAYININGSKVESNLYLIAEDSFGITAYNFLMLQDIPFLIKYNAHFFKRYRERMGLGGIKPAPVVKEFFRYNIQITPAYKDLDQDNRAIAAITLPQ